MTIEREHYEGPIVFRCDGVKCHEYEETGCEVFSGALAKIKSHGWTIRKVGNEWFHYCKDCSDDL